MDILHRYNHSKHERRTRSALRQKDKLKLRKQLDAMTISGSNRPKSVLEHQRKEWGKMSKKCKPRAQKRAALLPRDHIEDNPWNELSCSDSDCDSDSDQSRAYSVDSYSRRKKGVFWENDDLKVSLKNVYPPIDRDPVRSLLSYQFRSYDLKHMRFDMSSFNGQCAYWHYIMDRLGVVDEVFYGYYLSRCDQEEDGNSKWYRQKVTDQLLSSVHCLYIFDEVKRAADRQFDSDISSAHPVVQGQDVLVDILYRHNTEGLLMDLCAMIGGFVMNKKEISWRYHQRDVADQWDHQRVSKAVTSKYKVDGHSVVDRIAATGRGRRLGGCLMGKVFDGLDITERRNEIWIQYQVSSPLFEPYGQMGSWRRIRMMTWSKFKEYYHRQKGLGLEVQWSMIFVILLHFIDGTDTIDFNHFEVYKQRRSRRYSSKQRSQDRRILDEALSATEHDALQQSLWHILKTEGDRAYDRIRHSEDCRQRFRGHLVEALSHCETNEDVGYLCSMMADNERFMQFDDDMFETKDDPHSKFKEFWNGIWKHLNADWNVQPVYDLMVKHCRKYRSFSAETKCAWVAMGDGEYGWVHLDAFSVTRFLWTDIAPIMVDRVCPDSDHKENVKQIVATKRVKTTFDEMVSMIRGEERQQVMLSEHDGAMNCECDAMALVDGRRDEYRRRIESRRKEKMRQRMRREYRKWNGKSDEMRIRRKMRKYGLRADI